MIMTRHEKEKMILDLYNQGKTYKEIAKIAKVSVRDIQPILEKAVRAREKELAYRLFSEGKTPLDVAIELNLEESEATRYYREYWNLRHLYSLNMVYEEIGDDNIIHLLKVHKKIKEAGMGVVQAVTLIKNANNDLQTLEEKYKKLKRDVDSLEPRKLEADRTLNDLHDQIDRAEKMRKWLETERQEEENEIERLESEKIRLEQLVKQIKHNDKEYLKIERKIQSKVTNLLSDGKGVLKVAVDSLMKSMRNDPQKYINLIYYNQNSSASRYTEYIYVNGQQPYSSFDYFREVYKSILLEDAEKLFNKLIRELTGQMINEYSAKYGSTKPPSLRLLDPSS
jgi:DNA repair exonuclease SbcCD ATPase subunit